MPLFRVLVVVAAATRLATARLAARLAAGRGRRADARRGRRGRHCRRAKRGRETVVDVLRRAGGRMVRVAPTDGAAAAAAAIHGQELRL
jgi:hypothetical protein